MLLYDYITANPSVGVREGDFSILATDISEKVLATARAAEYGKRDVARGLTPALLCPPFRAARGRVGGAGAGARAGGVPPPQPDREPGGPIYPLSTPSFAAIC